MSPSEESIFYTSRSVRRLKDSLHYHVVGDNLQGGRDGKALRSKRREENPRKVTTTVCKPRVSCTTEGPVESLKKTSKPSPVHGNERQDTRAYRMTERRLRKKRRQSLGTQDLLGRKKNPASSCREVTATTNSPTRISTSTPSLCLSDGMKKSWENSRSKAEEKLKAESKGVCPARRKQVRPWKKKKRSRKKSSHAVSAEDEQRRKGSQAFGASEQSHAGRRRGGSLERGEGGMKKTTLAGGRTGRGGGGHRGMGCRGEGENP